MTMTDEKQKQHHEDFCTFVDRLEREGRGARGNVSFGTLSVDMLHVGGGFFHAVGSELAPVLLPKETLTRQLWASVMGTAINK